MNSDEIKSALGQLATAIFAMLTATGVITADTAHDLTGALTALVTSITAAVPAILMIVSVVSSIWRHWNQKKVPEKAVMLAPR